MKVSIVIATYNRKNVLMKSIQSVLDQTYSNLEILVVDDGSTDETWRLFHNKELDPRIRYLQLDKNNGSTVARNKGISEAQGEYIMVWDSDDVLYPYALEVVMNTFEKMPSASIVSSPARQIRNKKIIDYKKVNEGIVSLQKIMCKHLPNNEKVRVARAGLFKKVKYQARNLDFMVNVHLAQNGEWYHLSQELGDVILESDTVSLTTIRKKSNISRSIQRTEPLCVFLESFGDGLIKTCPKRYSAYAYGAAVGLLLSGKKKKSLKLSWSAVQYHRQNVKYVLLFIFTPIPFSSTLLRFLFYLKKHI